MDPRDDPADNKIQGDYDNDDADDDEVLLSLEEGTIMEIRPGRNLFCRHKTVLQRHSWENEKREDIENVHLVCIHGTAASHDQFLPLLDHLKKNINNNNNSNNNIRRHSKTNVHAWMYDAVGCGRSPDPPSTFATGSSSSSSSSPYSDEEQVLDLDAFLRRFVIRKMRKEEEQQQHQQQQELVVDTTKSRVFFLAHSYGPNWVYKWMKYNNRRQQQEIKERKELSSDHVAVEGLVLISTGLLDDDDRNRKQLLVKGGPAIFKYCPLWILNCLQPTMTELFLKMGYSQHTHATKPQMIIEARHANNGNNMKTVCQYYNSHDWISHDELQKFYNDFICSRTSEPPTSVTTGKRRRNVKVLVVHGVEDQIIPIDKGQIVANILMPPTNPKQLDENEPDSINNNLFVVEDASHSIMQEQPDVLSKHILQFVGL